MQLPRFLRQFFFDVIQGTVVGVVLLNIAIPGSLNEAGAAALVAGSAIARVAITALATAATAAAPRFLAWLIGALDLEVVEDPAP